ncbi:unnamed protein product [Ostreobium quekettii]|uniref:Uncharacterized protein n=1 Tax=Ostreobium quekettii TaxID=121088 RepID=A0A8S1J6U0_9CHLO|nr:unnamed protein product [Ostreobium quekettii]
MQGERPFLFTSQHTFMPLAAFAQGPLSFHQPGDVPHSHDDHHWCKSVLRAFQVHNARGVTSAPSTSSCGSRNRYATSVQPDANSLTTERDGDARGAVAGHHRLLEAECYGKNGRRRAGGDQEAAHSMMDWNFVAIWTSQKCYFCGGLFFYSHGFYFTMDGGTLPLQLVGVREIGRFT